jgi:hypothetical protein
MRQRITDDNCAAAYRLSEEWGTGRRPVFFDVDEQSAAHYEGTQWYRGSTQNASQDKRRLPDATVSTLPQRVNLTSFCSNFATRFGGFFYQSRPGQSSTGW